MRKTNRLLIVAALFVLVLPLIFTGATSAKYMGDGAVQNGTTGEWITPNDMVCLNGVYLNGNLDIVSGVTNARDCIYYNTGLTGMDPVDVTASSQTVNVCASGANTGKRCTVATSAADCGSAGLCTATAAIGSSANTCTGTNPSTLGSLTWVAGPNKCYDNTPCLIAGFAGGTIGGITYPANTGGRHSVASSICVDGSGNGISLAGLDRTAQMCAAKGGTWKQTSATAPAGFSGTFPTPGFGGACVAYGRQFKGQDASGTPLTFGTNGTTAATAGYCYTSMNFTAAGPGSTNYTSATCPSVGATATPFNSNAAYDWSWASSQCRYAKGIAGKLPSALTKVDGTTIASGTYIDLSTYTTMGDCIANGGSWNNWVGTAATTSVTGTDSNVYKRPNWDYTRQAPDADNSCLHCHSSLTEYNGPAEREKDSYLKTGHKNMLRKVTAGKKWAGPDASGVITPYTDYAAGSINWTAGTAQVSGVDNPLLYIFGDWMAPAPGGLDVVVDTNTAAHLAKYNGSSNYSCAACHTAGWSNPGPGTCSNATATSLGSLDQATCEAAGKVWTDAGLCSLSSKKSQSACTTAGGTWYPASGVQAIGTPGYQGTQPGDAFPTVTFQGAGKWDDEGITCGRCHNGAVGPVTRAQISGGSCAYTSAQCTAAGGTMSTGSNPTCNISMDYYTTSAACTAAGATWTAGVSTSTYPVTAPTSGGMGALAPGVLRNSLCFGCHQSMPATSNGTGADVDLNNPTGLIVKNNATAPAYTPGFSGHVLGNSFLNSPHARFTGTVVPNSLGKYDLATNTASNYNSNFRGYTCWQSPTSTSPAKTKADGTEIKTKTECETLYGAGAWRADTGSGVPTDLNSIQGTCTTCHDVHQSMFVAGQEGLRKECVSCHANSTYASDVPGTAQATTINHPTGAGSPAAEDPADPCVVCHMPKPTSGDFPMHVWRINSDPSYSTFPTAAEFGIGATATKKNANTAMDSKGYTNAVWVDVDLACRQCHNGSVTEAPTLTKTQLAVIAKVMHSSNTTSMSDSDCLTCHSTAVGTKRAINPGVDHHNGACQTCHPADPSGNGHFKSAWATAGVAVPNINATTMTHQTREAPYFWYWAINTSLRTACLGCHSSAQPKAAGGTVGAIVPSGTGDNHHSGHSSVPGTSFGGVAEVAGDPVTPTSAGSRGDNDPGMNCLGCHGKATITGGDSTVGYTMKFAASGLSTSTVASQNGRTNTSGLCMGCHEVIQSGPTSDHHAGECTSCHSTNGSTANGTYAAGVGTLPGGVVNCTIACHGHEIGAIPAITIINHMTGTGMPSTCVQCHSVAANPAGTPPTVGSYVGVIPDTQSTCGQCHADVSTISNAAATMHGNGVGTPDLSVTTLTVPINGGAGKELSVTYTVSNIGTGAGGSSHTNFYISTNAKPAGSVLASRPAPALAASGTFTETISLTLPSTPNAGTFYIVAVADASNEIPNELYETNNTAFKMVRVGPDYVLGSLVAPTSGVHGGTISVNVTTTNSGVGDALVASNTKFYLSTNGRPAGSALVTIPVAALTAGASYTPASSLTLTIPGATAAGKYYIVAVADDGNAVAEVYETNNTIFRAITIQ